MTIEGHWNEHQPNQVSDKRAPLLADERRPGYKVPRDDRDINSFGRSTLPV